MSGSASVPVPVPAPVPVPVPVPRVLDSPEGSNGPSTGYVVVNTLPASDSFLTHVERYYVSQVGDVLRYPAHTREAFNFGETKVPLSANIEDWIIEGSKIAALYRAESEMRIVAVIEGPGWLALGVFYKLSCNVDYEIAATSMELAIEVLGQLGARLSKPLPPEPGTVEMQVWVAPGGGSTSSDIKVASWDLQRLNYPPRVQAQLDRVVATPVRELEPEVMFLIVSGEPGTGKTRFLQSLCGEWETREQTRSELMLSAAEYWTTSAELVRLLQSVPFNRETGARDETRWRVLICEDADRLIARSSDGSTNPAVENLLQVTDGLLGAGRRIIIVCSTNLTEHQIHPALLRPGRSAGFVVFEPFSRAEANEWLGDVGTVDGPRTLAELYALRAQTSPIYSAPAERTLGQYL